MDGYMFSEMYHLEGGQMSGGFPLQSLDDDMMSGGGRLGAPIQLASYVIPIGLVCDMRVAPRHIEYVNALQDIDDVAPIDDSLHDILYENITRNTGVKGSRKKHMRNPSKKKSLKVRKI